MRNIVLLIVLILMIILAYVLMPQDTPAQSATGKSPIQDASRIQPGYVLLAPLNINIDEPGMVYLTDRNGKIVHKWNTKHPVLYARLAPDGSLYAAQMTAHDPASVPDMGWTGLLERMDWEGNVSFSYTNPTMHHDFEILPNGNIAVLQWDKASPELAAEVEGGIPENTQQTTMWTDTIVEINSKGNMVWNWQSNTHLDTAIDEIGYFMKRNDWTHSNSIRYLAKNPMTQSPAYLVSMRQNSTVYIIDRTDGSIVWRSPKGTFNHQHDATLTPQGTILVFDNGSYRTDRLTGSRAVEIDPRTNKIIWEFDGGADVISKIRFDATVMGGAQRLPNGNTLIVDGLHGHLLEVTRDKKLVWDFINPYSAYSGVWPVNALFKSQIYMPNEIQWPQPLPASVPGNSIF